MSETLKSVTLKSLVQTGKVTGISNLRKNTTGLYYVTLLNGSKPNNVYILPCIFLEILVQTNFWFFY